MPKKQTVKSEAWEKKEQLGDLKLPVHDREIPDKDIMVVLLNMGGPKNIAEVRPFLKRLFLDSLIIRIPFSFLLQGAFAWMIVAARGKKTEHRYGLIGGGSPIFKSTADQTVALAQELKKRGRDLSVTFSFNYSDPLPEETIEQIKRAGKKYILPVSLYPHHSAATTGSNLYYLRRAAAKLFPDLVFLKSQAYYLHDDYIGGFVERIQEQLRPGESLEDFYLLFSAHGLPLYFLTEGDIYPFEISQTVAKILTWLQRSKAWSIAYQSAVGPMRWLKPSTGAMLEALARRGIKRILVIPISFVTDHIETICEINIEYRQFAEGLGIHDFRMSKALECHPGFIGALADSVEESLGKPGSRNSFQPAPETVSNP